MKKQFQSKSVPRGTRTIWRYLGAFILLFSLSIGQMWGASTITVKLYVNGGGTISASGWESKSSGTYYQKKVNKSTAFDLPAPTREGFTFDEWNTSAEGTGSSYTTSHSGSGSNINLYAQWTELPKYTVTYYQGTGVLLTEQVYQGSSPKFAADILEHYTSGSWYSDAKLTSAANPATDAISAAKSYYLSATGPKYATDVDLYAEATGDKTNINTLLDSKDYVSDIVWNSSNYDDGNSSYYGYKCKTNGDWVEFLLKRGDEAKVTFKYIETNFVIYAGSTTGTAVTNDEKSYSNSSNDIIVRIVNNCVNGKSATINKIQIIPTYTATLVDSKSDGAGSQANVTETTLPTPTAVSGWTFTGWIANEDVKAGEDTKTAGTVLAAGTYTLLANTTFTAQWAEASSTYDITYVSAHGTAPDAENAASVVLAELDAEGWAHKGWTANVDVTVDAATVEAGTLIANGKTAILASDVTFTAVWKEIFTVTFDAKGGSSVDPVDVEDGATLAAAPADPTKDDYIFLGWSETDGGDVVADITAITISDDKTFYAKWKLDVQVSEIVFSNSFKGWIHDSQVEVFYMAGESAPTITSYAGKNLKAEGGVVISGDKIIATGTDDSEVEFDLAMTEVTPLATTGAQTFDGSEGYVKTRHAWTADRKWKMSKYATDGRVAQGNTSMYIFLGPAESVTFNWGKQQKTNDVAVYVNGTFVKNLGKDNNSAVELTNGNNMVAFYSLQTSGDVWLNGLTVAPWVPVTGVTLKEGEDAISSKEIWESTSFTLTAEVTPDNASDKTITWTSSNNDVATVVNGVVTGVAASADPVTITASTVDGVNATCVVTVTEAPSPCETPTINTQPASQAYCAGSEPTLSVEASVTDGGTLHYAWFKDDVAIGSDAATCVVTGAGTYKVVVTNKKEGKLDASATSANAVVTLNAPASITTQPTDLKKQTEGANITLSVVAANATGYQWYSCDNKDKENPSLIPGADEAEYEFAAAAGFFYCEVTGLCGNVESNVAQVTVKRSAGCQYITATSGYEATLADGLKLYACGSDGKTSTDGIFADATSDVTTVDADAVGEFNKQYIIMKFPVDVEEITLYGTNSSDRSINSVRVKSTIGSTSADKFTDDMIVATTKTATREGKDISMTAVMDEPISKDDYVFVNFNGGSMHVYRICYTAAIERPVIATQPVSNTNFAFDADLTATVEVNAVSEGALYYQWYDASDDSEVDGATADTLTTSVDGEYYVIVTNKLAGHKDNSVKSQTVALAHRDATDATLSALGYGDPATAIALEADKYEYRVDLAEGTIDVPVLSATATKDGYANVVITNATAFENYEATSTVLVTAEDGVTQKTYTVKFVVDHIYTALVDVTESTTWNWSGSAEAVINDVANKGLILANYIDGANFEMIEGKENERARRNQNGGCYQGTQLHFNTTVYGKVKIYFRAPSSGDNCTIYVNNNGKRMNVGNRGNSFGWSKEVIVKGDVVIEMVKDGGGDTRVQQIVFTQVAPDYTREVSNNIGTLCVDHNVLAGGFVGATFYQIASRNEIYNDKIDFEEVGESEELVAGQPYIFQSTTGRIDLFYGATAVTEPEAVRGMHGWFDAAAPIDPTKYDMLDITEENKDDILYISSNKLWSCGDLVDSNLKVVNNRAYIVMSEVPTYEQYTATPSAGAPRRRVTLGKDAEQTTTGVDNLNASEQPVKLLINGQLFIIRGEKMFNANGQLVK